MREVRWERMFPDELEAAFKACPVAYFPYVPPQDEPGPHFAMGKTVRKSNRQTGERMVKDEVAWLGKKAQALRDAYQAEQPTQQLRTFDQVEQLWETVIRPEIKNFRTMQNSWTDDGPKLPEDSIWYANWQVPDRG